MAEHFGSIAKGYSYKDADKALSDAKKELKAAKKAKKSAEVIRELEKKVNTAQAIRNQF